MPSPLKSSACRARWASLFVPVSAALVIVGAAACGGGAPADESTPAEEAAPAVEALPEAPPAEAAPEPASEPVVVEPVVAEFSENPIPTSEQSIRMGRALYAKTCRACHGLRGEGDGPTAPPGTRPANLVDDEWKWGSTDPQLHTIIKRGLPPFDVMEPWGQQLSDDDIWNVINFLRDMASGRDTSNRP